MELKLIFRSFIKIISLEKITFFYFIFLSILITLLEILNVYVISSFLNFALAENTNKFNIFNFLNISSFTQISVITMVTIFLRSLGSFYIKSFEFKYVYRILSKSTFNYFNSILNLNYKKILNFKPSQITNTLLNELVNLILGIFNPIIIIFIESLIAITLIAYTFLFVDKIFIFIAACLLILYAVFFILINPINTTLGVRRVDLEQKRFNSINDNIRGIRHLKFNNAKFLTDVLSNILLKYGDVTAKKKIIGSSSRYLLELIAYIGLFSIIIFSYFSKEIYISNMITLAIISIRIIPSFNRVISESLVVKFNLPVLKKAIILDYIALSEPNSSTEKKTDNNKINFDEYIHLKNINFRYGETSKSILKNYSVRLIKNKINGISGKSGVGKTTLINIICNLLEIDSGKIYVDKLEIIYPNKVWRNNISLFSQDSFIFNGTIKENIVFGEKFESKRFKDLCKSLNIFEFIDYKNLNTVIDPYKTNLSGGQLQRILIARTLYKRKLLYIFDEPTTNLDPINKNYFFNYLKNNKNTYLIISHDKDVLKICNKKFYIS